MYFLQGQYGQQPYGYGQPQQGYRPSGGYGPPPSGAPGGYGATPGGYAGGAPNYGTQGYNAPAQPGQYVVWSVF
jgi:hypothetical protein